MGTIECARCHFLIQAMVDIQGGIGNHRQFARDVLRQVAMAAGKPPVPERGDNFELADPSILEGRTLNMCSDDWEKSDE